MPTLDTIVVEVVERGPQGRTGGLPNGDKGDITVAQTGDVLTINDRAATNAKLADMAQATVKGRASGAGTGAPSDLTGAQARTVLDLDNTLRRVADRSAMAAVSGVSFPAVDLVEAGREGLFRWSSANLASEVSADSQQALYVPPASDVTGASGAWVRQWDGVNAFASWWGVKADNATDDTTALQAAVSAAAPVLNFSPGTMLWASNSTLNGVSNQKWVGSGIGPSVLKLTASAPAADFVTFSGNADIELRNLTLDWNNKTPAGGNGTLALASCDRVKVIGCKFPNIASFGLVSTGLRDSQIRGCFFEKNAAASTFNQAILISSTGRAAYNNRVAENDCARTGVIVYGARTWITDNRIYDFGFGAGITLGAVSDSYDNVVARNIISGGTGTDSNGYRCGGIEGWSARTVYSGNIVFGNSGSGLEFGGQHSTVTGNICYNNGMTSPGGSGLVARYQDATYNASNSVVFGNRCYDTAGAGGTQTYGYEEQSASLSSIHLSGNNFSGNKTGTVSILSTSTGQIVAGYLRGVTTCNNNLIAGIGTGARYVRANGGSGASEGAAFLLDVSGVFTGGFGHKSAILGGVHDETVINYAQSGQPLEGVIGVTVVYNITPSRAQFTVPMNLTTGNAYQINSVQVVGDRKTGWATATGTATRTTFDTATVTTAQLAERVKALIDDLHATAGHGLIGA